MSEISNYFCLMEWNFTLKDISRVAKEFWEHAGDKKVFAFHGDIGAGKTTFISELCRAKGIKDTASSPTFSLINDYVFTDETGIEQHLFHLDLYRIHDEEEAIHAGIEDALYSGAICMVEWAEKIPNLLPEETIHVTIVPGKEGRKLVSSSVK